jgi:hypothetical protein
LVLTPLLGFGAGALLAFVYAYINSYNPFIYITFLATLGLGFGAGMGVVFGLQKGKARNRLVASGLGLFAGVFTLYCSWAVYAYVLLQRADVEGVSLVGMLLNPEGLFSFIVELNGQGAWSIKGTTPTGWFLWLVWALEAVIIVGIPTFLGFTTASAPFCEKCLEWSVEMKNLLRIASSDKDEVKHRLEALDTAYVLRAAKPAEGANEWCRFDMTQCKCKETTTISAVFIKLIVKDKELKEDETTVVTNLLMPADFADQLLSAGQQTQASPEPVPA